MKSSQACKYAIRVSIHTLGFNMLSRVLIIYDIGIYFFIDSERAESEAFPQFDWLRERAFFYDI